MLFLKVTFFILYLDIFRPLRWLRLCGYTGALFTVMFYGAVTVASFVFATPRPGETLFDRQTTTKTRHASELSVAQSIVGLVIDIAVLILPVIAVMQLQLPNGRKIGVILIFMTGLL